MRSTNALALAAKIDSFLWPKTSRGRCACATRYRSVSAFDAHRRGCYHLYAGWSSLVARWAHNPKVGGSNPPPATNEIINIGDSKMGSLFYCAHTVRELLLHSPFRHGNHVAGLCLSPFA